MWFIQEYLLILWLHAYGLFRPKPPDQWGVGDKGTFVLVNGLNENWAFFKYIGDELNSLGYRIVWVPTLGFEHQSIHALAEILKKFILSQDLRQYYLLCHSKGALFTKKIIEEGSVPRPKHIFCIASPFGGSRLGLVPISHIRELHPKSDIVSKLRIDHGFNTLFTSIYPIVDNHILISESSNLMNANNVRIPISGHTRILFDPRCVDTIKDILEKG
jgi:hypothetical protein